MKKKNILCFFGLSSFQKRTCRVFVRFRFFSPPKSEKGETTKSFMPDITFFFMTLILKNDFEFFLGWKKILPLKTPKFKRQKNKQKCF